MVDLKFSAICSLQCFYGSAKQGGKWQRVAEFSFALHCSFGKFKLRGDFFYEIVRVTSGAKAFF